MDSLPQNLDAERLVLGASLTDPSGFTIAASVLDADDFSIEKNRRIFLRMQDLSYRGEKIDRITVINELMKCDQLESVDGAGGIVELDEGLPRVHNLEGYAHIVKQKARLRRMMMVCQDGLQRCSMAQEEPDDILASLEAGLLGMASAGPQNGLATPLDILNEAGGMDAFMQPGRRLGASTGFVKFDDMTGGLRGGELVIVAARPSMGKTAFLLNVADWVATHRDRPRPALIFSLEMSKDSVLMRMICSRARMDLQKFRAGYATADERRALQIATAELADSPLLIDDNTGVNLMEIHSKAKRVKAEHGELGLIGVDYMQLMRVGGKHENRNQELTHLSRGLKLMARDLDTPVVALSQLSRDCEKRPGDKRPLLADLRESGAIEQDADLVAFLFREEYYKRDREDLKGQAELIIRKQRNGPIGTVKLTWVESITRFENPASLFDGEE